LAELEDAPGIDALLPPLMTRRAEEAGLHKAATETVGLFVLAVLAGALIVLGGVFATTALAGTGAAPWGPARVRNYYRGRGLKQWFESRRGA
jgi:formate/nitrite transporter FocA (FNT family)